LAAFLVGALLVGAGMPVSGTLAGGARGADCHMTCCKTAGMRTMGHAATPLPSPTCHLGCGHRQEAGAVGPMPSVLAAPTRLPAPASARFAPRRPASAYLLDPFDLPDRPPRLA